MNRINREYGLWLSSFNWDLYATFTYRYTANRKKNQYYMEKIFEFPDIKKMFWTSEYFKNGTAIHTHAIIETDNPINTSNEIKKFWNRIGLSAIDPFDENFNLTHHNTKYENGTGCTYYVTKFIGYDKIDYDFYKK